MTINRFVSKHNTRFVRTCNRYTEGRFPLIPVYTLKFVEERERKNLSTCLEQPPGRPCESIFVFFLLPVEIVRAFRVAGC